MLILPKGLCLSLHYIIENMVFHQIFTHIIAMIVGILIGILAFFGFDLAEGK